MPEIITSGNESLLHQSTKESVSRRRFLAFGALGASALAIGLSSCDKDDDNNDNGIDLGSGDIGVLNYAYALEQLEAAFYARVIQSPYSGAAAGEIALLTDIRDHEIAHREFFKSAIPAANRVQDLTPDFTSINFADRSSVLAAAKAFEDLGVSAYNGAGKLLVSPAYLTLAGKIVSVEARHAAYIRDLLSNGSFADSTVVDSNGLDKSRSPKDVLQIANIYLSTKVSARNLPTS